MTYCRPFGDLTEPSATHSRRFSRRIASAAVMGRRSVMLGEGRPRNDAALNQKSRFLRNGRRSTPITATNGMEDRPDRALHLPTYENDSPHASTACWDSA